MTNNAERKVLMPAKTEITLGAVAEGAINPADRVATGEITEAEITEVTEALTTEAFYDPINVDQFMPRCCVDGRHRADGGCQMGANTAGGVFTLFVADMLTTQRFRGDAQTTLQYASNLFDHLDQAGYAGQYGNHRGEDAPAGMSGCGAIDKMPSVIAFIAEHGDRLRDFAQKNLGVIIDDEDHDLIVGMAKRIADRQDVQLGTGDDLDTVLEHVASKDVVDVLGDVHKEVAVVVNEREGTTLNRAKVAAQTGGRLQAFNYDRWAVRKAVQTISQNVEINEARKKLVAADYFNLAVACVLAGPTLRVVARSQEALTPVAA